MTFKPKRVEPGAGGAFKLIGDLTIRGTTKEVVLDGQAMVEAGPVVGDEVTITPDIEAGRPSAPGTNRAGRA